jgi:uncharacterized membrane protein
VTALVISNFGSTLFVLAWLIGVPTLIVLGVMALARGSRLGQYQPSPDPEEILKVRLARGEINIEEYERLRGFMRS